MKKFWIAFIVLAVAFPSLLNTERFLFYGVVPLILVPITFAYAIVRFQLMDVRVILRKSLMYTVTTAVITAIYALGIAVALVPQALPAQVDEALSGEDGAFSRLDASARKIAALRDGSAPGNER